MLYTLTSRMNKRFHILWGRQWMRSWEMNSYLPSTSQSLPFGSSPLTTHPLIPLERALERQFPSLTATHTAHLRIVMIFLRLTLDYHFLSVSQRERERRRQESVKRKRTTLTATWTMLLPFFNAQWMTTLMQRRNSFSSNPHPWTSKQAA